jgi:hypothetical protein
MFKNLYPLFLAVVGRIKKELIYYYYYFLKKEVKNFFIKCISDAADRKLTREGNDFRLFRIKG